MAIIDNYISKNEVANLIGKDITVIDAHGNSIKEYKWAEMTHGTVCTSILAEKFKDANITAVSLWDSHMEISLGEVCSAFQLFEKSNFKCICLSMLFPCSWAFGCKLMLAGSAEILLIPIWIFAVTIK